LVCIVVTPVMQSMPSLLYYTHIRITPRRCCPFVLVSYNPPELFPTSTVLVIPPPHPSIHTLSMHLPLPLPLPHFFPSLQRRQKKFTPTTSEQRNSRPKNSHAAHHARVLGRCQRVVRACEIALRGRAPRGRRGLDGDALDLWWHVCGRKRSRISCVWVWVVVVRWVGLEIAREDCMIQGRTGNSVGV